MANGVFELQRSRFAMVLQLLIFIAILSLTYSLLALWIWLLCFCMMGAAWILFLKQPQIKRFEYLDHQECSFEFYDPELKIQRRKIVKILDHKFYIALYFSHSNQRTCIIWWDQLSHSQWQKLKLRAKLA
ncbi:hypothetical protein NDN11_02165 [Acinetobacter sp. C26M]|uniref:hypothetical protein n=1 Tax=unclassified Acinetobacter TaxID=196816 RepID=UPI0020368D8A|nr:MULTISPECIES: hypothetical protein [unclassified Acinetobacter]USA48237.1 hypothetical protein NDN11_02165 [Acinetobacter sp. C26M]USA51720.1 hypothetical protein NDN12_02165 [Acinetobacter sp. C26G]